MIDVLDVTAMSVTDRMLIEAARRLNPDLDCNFVSDWLLESAESDDCRSLLVTIIQEKHNSELTERVAI